MDEIKPKMDNQELLTSNQNKQIHPTLSRSGLLAGKVSIITGASQGIGSNRPLFC